MAAAPRSLPFSATSGGEQLRIAPEETVEPNNLNNNEGAGSSTTPTGSPKTPLTNLFKGGNKVTPGGGAVKDAIKNNPVSKALNKIASDVKDALNKGNDDGATGGSTGGGTATP